MFQEIIDQLDAQAKEKIGLRLNEKQLRQFILFGDLLLEWNKKINLTRIVEPEQVVVKHFLDSLILAGYALGNKLCDIGTGAGFPGIPLKITLPSLEVTLMDSLKKRIDFLNIVIEELGLISVRAIHFRAEEFGQQAQNRHYFESVASRAVAGLPVLLEYALPLLKIGGFFYAMKSVQVEEELKIINRPLEILGGLVDRIEEINLGPLAERRTVVVIKKVDETPKQYPRKAGMPEKKPL